MRPHGRRLWPLALLAMLVSACGSSGSSSPPVPTVAPAKVFSLGSFSPSGTVAPKTPVELSFHIVLPSGETLTRFKTGSGPHTGVHLIIVRNDLSTIVHRHPAIAADGTVRQSVSFPEPGTYHVLVDIYPVIPDTPQLVNFQLTSTIHVSGAAKTVPLPAFAPEVAVGGFHVTMEGVPRLQALQPAFVTIRIRGANGTRPNLEPWYGALAHAIFFRAGSLAYFHTHICAPRAPGCASLVGRKLTGTGTSNGNLHVGILLPQAGRWRLFLQFQVKGQVLTAPFTLQVH